ncbi:MAG: deoxynucleoside kinase [Oscillospiraceae bacterium]|nr:deoxynucleoside kinase [Oscillospiraceae bacterium]
MNGKLIVIDGIDGCGKTTQTNLLYEYLKINYPFKLISFPNYENKSSSLVKMYLDGEINKNPSEINPFAASSFYSADRYISYMIDWKKDYDNGINIISARYVSSNAIHQTPKLNSIYWDKYLDWLYDYEYNKLLLPKPDLTIFLSMSKAVSNKLIEKRNIKKDIHESDKNYIDKCYESYNYICKKHNYKIINCCDGINPLTKEKIFDKILKEIQGVL